MSINEQPAKLSYSIDEAAKATSLSRSKIYNLISTGELKTKHVGRRQIISASALRDLIEGVAA